MNDYILIAETISYFRF